MEDEERVEMIDESSDLVKQRIRARESFRDVSLPAICGAIGGGIGTYAMESVSMFTFADDYLGGVYKMNIVIVSSLVVGSVVMLMHAKRQDLSPLEFLAGGWFLGLIALVLSFGLACGFVVLIFLWFYSSVSWPKHAIPPFRRGFFWGLGLVVGGLVGGLVCSVMITQLVG